MSNRRTIELLGVRIDSIDKAGLSEKIVSLAKAKTPNSVMYVNADCMLLSRKDAEYRSILNRADVVYADGIGVVWGARLWRFHLPGRMTAADFMPEFFREWAKLGLRIYLLGGRKGVAAETARRFRENINGLQIVGASHGYFRPEDTAEVIAGIRQARPHILLVGFGAPLQEKWIASHAQELCVPVIWGVGGLFDFLSGRLYRGPQWLLDHGFEWFCRLMVEPRRLWRRYLIGNLKFILVLLRYRFGTSGTT